MLREGRMMEGLAEAEADQTRHGLLSIIVDHYVGIAEGMDSLCKLGADSKIALVVWGTPEALPRDLRNSFAQAVGGCQFTESLPATPREVMTYHGVYVPIAPNGLAYALSQGDDRDPVVRTLLMAAFVGLPIALLATGLEPNGTGWAKAGMGRAAAIWPDAWRMRMQTLRGLGIDLLRQPDEVGEWASNRLDGPRILDIGLVDMWHEQGMTGVGVGVKTIVTPGAHDRLREYGMTLQMNGERTWRSDK